MTKHLRKFVEGMGSILDIAEEPRVYRHVYRDSDQARLQGDLARIGRDMQIAVGKADGTRNATSTRK